MFIKSFPHVALFLVKKLGRERNTGQDYEKSLSKSRIICGEVKSPF
jgi:hypothetical protein